MIQLGKRIFLAACGLVGIMALSACGGDDASGGGTAQTITFVSPGNQNLLQATAPLVATSTSGLPVSFLSTTPSVCTASGTSLTLVSRGSCTVRAVQFGDSTFAAAAPVSNTFEVSVLLTAQTITFTSPGNQVFGVAPAPLVATSTSGLTVAFASTTPNFCTVAAGTTTLTLVAAGPCTVVASQAGNATYAAAAIVPQSFTVAVGAQSINFTSPGDQILGTAPAPLSATSTSGLVVTFASTTPVVCTVSGTTLTLLSAGTCTVTADQAGDANYAAAPQELNSFAVAKTPQTITFISPGNQVLGSVPAALAATASSGLAVSFASTTPAVCTVSGTTLSLVAVGTCIVSASQAGNASFAAAAPVSNSFAVAASLTAQTITFTSPGNQTLGTAPGPLVATSTSGLTVAFASTTPLVCTVSGTTLTLVAVGTCTVAASQAGNSIYSAAPVVPQSFSVAATPQTITFVSPGNKTLSTGPFALVATASSGLAVSFASTTPSICTVSGTTLTLAAAGSCTINASQAGNTTFAPAPTVPQTFTVSAAALIAQTITFASPGNQTVGTPATLVATASSTLPVAFASSTLPVCTVSGNTLTLLTAGSCTVVASQAGNSVYAAAPPVPRTITVAAAAVNGFANGGFEDGPGVAPAPLTPAANWLPAGSGGYSVDTNAANARSGSNSLLLACPATNTGGCSGIAVQNSVKDGNLAPLVPGATRVLSFYAKGFIGTTGDAKFKLEYLDGIGNILYSSGLQNFAASIVSTATYNKVTFTSGIVPAGAVAAYLQLIQESGPVGPQGGAGQIFTATTINIDDVTLVTP